MVKAILDKKRQGNIPVFIELKRYSTPSYFGECKNGVSFSGNIEQYD